MRPVLLSFFLATAAPLAQPPVPIEELSRCLADNTSGKDRKQLARWVFFAIAAHPEIKQYAARDLASASEETHEAIAAIVTRLLADSCPAQAKAALNQGGSKAIGVAFQTLGQLAMQELMSNPDVSASMGKFEKLLDQAKLQKALSGG